MLKRPKISLTPLDTHLEQWLFRIIDFAYAKGIYLGAKVKQESIQV
jgi:hypothetical protein